MDKNILVFDKGLNPLKYFVFGLYNIKYLKINIQISDWESRQEQKRSAEINLVMLGDDVTIFKRAKHH